ncbi:hypothetical protein [Micromonospora costi]|uniref:Uncharacterized protein n=1 Tax=Micromonospora costi TaxID=1530042 RepID=A0A3B0AAD3_9ACTN|nr:hypothetical protein [Micromonospora costi]RKN56027.1 hypothetical protein D7193_15860 [Micromonospora costi]
MTTRTAETVTLNPRYAVPLGTGRIACTQVPAGMWAVKVRQRGDHTIAYVVPRYSTAGRAFVLAVGDDQRAVFGAAIRWTGQAKTLACHIDRVVFAGYGDATYEQLSDLDGLPVVFDSQEAR